MPESKPHPLAYAMREWPNRKPKLATPCELMDAMARETCGEVTRPIQLNSENITDSEFYRKRMRILLEIARTARKNRPTDTYQDDGWY